MKQSIDWLLVTAYLLAAFLSLTIIFSISPDRLAAQALSLGFGFVLFVYLAHQDQALYTTFSRLAYPLALALLSATFIFGESVRGSIRWIVLGPFHFQTSELVKPLLILFFSRFFTAHPPTALRPLLLSFFYLAVPLGLILFQPDLGTALVILAVFTGQLLVAGAPWWLFLFGLIAIGFVPGYAPHFLREYQVLRLKSFLDPSRDPLGSGYNVIQSIIAVGSGGVFGKGLGHGTQSHLQFLPERHTDFIFASLAEELGLVGGLGIIFTLGLLLYRLAVLMLAPLSRHNRLVISGIFTYFFSQTFINIGMNLGIAPVTGVTLPLISYGGSSILALSLALGIAGSISSSLRPSHSLEIK